MGFTPCKAEQQLQEMELQKKETQKDYLDNTTPRLVYINKRVSVSLNILFINKQQNFS